MRWITAVLTILLLTAASPLPASASDKPQRLTDIAGHWAEQSIVEAVKDGWVNGYPDGRFLPEKGVTRAEFVKMLSLIKLDPVWRTADQRTMFLADKVAETDHWAVSGGYVGQALAKGLLDPADYTITFGPDKNVAGWSLAPDTPLTRQEAVVLLVRRMGLKYRAEEFQLMPGGPPPEVPFTDRDAIPQWARGWIATAAGWYIQGFPDGAFHGDEIVTRAQAVTLLLRMKMDKPESLCVTNLLRLVSEDGTQDIVDKDPRHFAMYGDLWFGPSLSVKQAAPAWYRLPYAVKYEAMRKWTVAYWDRVQTSDIGILHLDWVAVTLRASDGFDLGDGYYDGHEFKYQDISWKPEPLLVDPALEAGLVDQIEFDSSRDHMAETLAQLRAEKTGYYNNYYLPYLASLVRTMRYTFPYQYLGEWFTLKPSGLASWAEWEPRAYWQRIKPQVEAIGGNLRQVRIEIVPSDTAGTAGIYRSLLIGPTFEKNPVAVLVYDGERFTVEKQAASLEAWLDGIEPDYRWWYGGDGAMAPIVDPPLAEARRVMRNVVYTLGQTGP